MLRDSLLALFEVSREIKVACYATCYEVHDYEDGSYVDLRLRKAVSVEKLASLTKGFDVSLHAENDEIVVRIQENYSKEH